MLGGAEIVEAVAASLRASRPLTPPLTLPLPAGGERGRTAPCTPLPARGERQGEGPGDWPQASPDAPRPFLIYDPVMVASSGDALAGAGFVEAVKARLLPLVDCLTPNLAEAAALLGAPLAQDEAEMARQGAALLDLGPRAVLMKGGHLAGDEAVDLLGHGRRRPSFRRAARRLAQPARHRLHAVERDRRAHRARRLVAGGGRGGQGLRARRDRAGPRPDLGRRGGAADPGAAAPNRRRGLGPGGQGARRPCAPQSGLLGSRR